MDEKELVDFLKKNLKIKIESSQKEMVKVRLLLNKTEIASDSCSICKYVLGCGPL